MKNQTGERVMLLKAQALQENPTAVTGKRIIGITLIVFFILRLFYLATELFCMAKGIFPFSPLNIIALWVAFIGGRLIYDGARAISALWIIGGVIMVVQSFQNQYLTVLGSREYLFSVRLYTAAFLITAYVQIICMLIILLNKKAKLYSEIIMKISKQYLEEQKQLSGKK